MTPVLKSFIVRRLCRLYSTDKTNSLHHRIPRFMRRWELTEYGSTDSLNLVQDAVVPMKLKTDQVLVKVAAASVNPIDVEMMEGYGRTAMNAIRKLNNIPEFPLVLGRDFSGVIVKRGHGVRRFKVGDKVWGARWVIGDGTHAEYCVAGQSEVALKPMRLSHIEAASIPYVACTTWVALTVRGGLDPNRTDNNKNVLILGGSGGIGTIAIQLSKHLGNHVTTTCSLENHKLVESLGADTVLNYKDDDYYNLIDKNGPYDIIIDARSGGQQEKVGSDHRTIYVTLMPPFLPAIDQDGWALGLINSGKEFYMQAFENFLHNKGKYAWGLFFPSSGVLKKIANLVDQEKICPVVSHVYDFCDAKKALEQLSDGLTSGKLVLKVLEE